MSPADIRASFEARQLAVSELRRLVEDVDGAEFNAEQQAEFDRHNDAIDSLDVRIRSGLDHVEREAKATGAARHDQGLRHRRRQHRRLDDV